MALLVLLVQAFPHPRTVLRSDSGILPELTIIVILASPTASVPTGRHGVPALARRR